MKRATKILMAALMGATLAATSVSAAASGYRGGGYRHGGGHWHGGHRHWHGHVHFGFGGWWPGYWGGYWGAPYWGPYWGGYAYSPTVVVQQEPRIYVERDDVGQAPSNGQWWYWCASAKGYYPYVSSCTEGWQRVAPQPPQAPR
jgi:hypothetical protein